MRRILPFLLALGVASAITTAQLGGGSGLQRGLTDSRFDQLVRERSTARNLVHDGIPRVAVKFDDGRDGQWDNRHIAAFLRRRLPVTMSLISSTITNASAGNATPLGTNANVVTWAVVRHLIDYAGQHGTTLSLANHTYNTWQGAPFAMNYEEYLNELQPDSIEAHTGIRPKVFIYPGDALAFMSRNKDTIAATLDSMGYIGAITGGAADSSGFGPQHIANTVAQDGVTSAQSSNNFVRPGVYKDPFYLPNGFPTVDLGVMVVERNASQASNTSTWTMRQNGGGDVSSVANWSKTFQTNLSLRLANNSGFVITMHDSVDTDAASYSITGLSAAEDNGAFSPEHIAQVLYDLQELNLIRVVSLEEWIEWAMSSYAPGTDLIANPNTLNPQFAIGDTFGVELGWLQGWGSIGWAGTNWASTYGVTTAFDAGAGNAAKYNRANDDPTDVLGAAKEGFMGRPYAFTPGASWTFSFAQNMLRPGRYRLVMPSNNGETSIGFREFHIAAVGRWTNSANMWGGSTTGVAYGDTVISYRWADQSFNIARPAAMDERWTSNFIDFTLPAQPAFVAGNAVNTGSNIFGSTAEQPTLFGHMWHDEWLWTVTMEMQTGGGGQFRFANWQLRYLGPIQ